MFTSRLFLLLGLCAAIGAASFFYPALLPAAKTALCAVLALLALDALCGLAVSTRLAAARKHPEHLSLGQPNPVKVTIALRWPALIRKLWKVTAYDITPPSFEIAGPDGMRGEGEFAYSVIPTARGRYEFDILRCFVTSRLGLCNVRRFISLPSQAKVYPTFHHLEKLETQAMLQHSDLGFKRQRRAGNSTDFDQIRAYVPGDDVRSVNWRATARVASLMVNTYSDERSQPIIPILCAGPAMLIANNGVSLLDRAASAAVALAASAVRHYDQAGLITVTHMGVRDYLPPERGKNTVAKILDLAFDFGLPPTPSERPFIADPDVLPDGIDAAALANIRDRMDACEADADFDALAEYALTRLKRRSLLVLFANFENLEVAKLAIPALNRLAKRHTLLVVLFENEAVSEVASAPARLGNKASNRSSELRFRNFCASYIEQQQLLAAALRKSRVNVVFTKPANLTSAVIASYLDLKARAII